MLSTYLHLKPFVGCRVQGLRFSGSAPPELPMGLSHSPLGKVLLHLWFRFAYVFHLYRLA